jgi:serpin B
MNNQQLVRLILAFLAVLITAGGAFAADGAAAGAKKAAESVNAFAFDMYAELASGEGNLFMSPYSVSSAMAMLYAGTSGEAEREVRDVLRYPEGLHPAMKELRDALEEDGNGELSVANAIWPDLGFKLLPAYLEIVRNYYGGEVTQFDFSNEWRDAEDAINKWTAEHTRDMIQSIFRRDDLMPRGRDVTSLVLTNAVYFFSKWKEPFQKDLTSDGIFFGATERETKFMRQMNSFPYFETEDVQLLEMPYEDGRRSFVALLPKERGDIKSLEAALTAGKFAEWRASARRNKVDVYIPKFELEWEKDLVPIFKSLGLESIFESSRDNYKNMTETSDEMRVSRIIHKTKITLDEEKTEAAAVTAIGIIRTTSIRPVSPPYEFHADHPFVFFIADNSTGAILFMGRFSDPK